MISYSIIYILLGFTIAFLLIVTATLIKKYVNNEADIRVVYFVQFLLVASFMITEAVHYLETGEANQMCILLTRNYLVFALVAHLNCKLIGYKNVYTSKAFRNIIFVIMNTLKYLVVISICLSYLGVSIVPTNSYSIERILQILKFMGTENYYPSYMSWIPIDFCALCCIFIIMMDFLERRDAFTKFMGFAELTPLVVLIFNMFPGYSRLHCSLKLILNSLYFIIPLTAMSSEAINILKCSKKSRKRDYELEHDRDTEKIIKKAFRENSKCITKSGEIQAKVIAKIIKKDEKIKDILPDNKKSQKYKKYIMDIVEFELK